MRDKQMESAFTVVCVHHRSPALELDMKMRCALCSLVCAGLLASVSFAQPPGGGRGGMGMGMGGGSLVALAKAKDVAADIKLSEDQVKKLEDLDKKLAEKRRSAMQDAA